MTITISLSCLHHGVQIRCTENPDTVARYTEILKESGWTFPPLTVVQVDGVYRVADGHHRLEAAKNMGLQEIPCKVIEGTEETLFKLAFEGNSMHGLAMSRADWKHAVELTINRFPDKSNRDLAEFCRCSHTTIKRIKDELETSGKYRKPETVTGKDGKTRKSTGTNVPVDCKPVIINAAERKQTPPPAALADYVTCVQCRETQPKGMTEQPDTTWRQIGLDDSGKYRWLCSDECEKEWNKEQESKLESDLENEQPDAGGNLRIFEEKPPKEPDSIVLEIGLACSVRDATDPKEALETIKEELPLALVGSRFRILKSNGIININLNELINNITGKPKAGQTEFWFLLKGGRKYFLTIAKYDQWKNQYHEINLDATLKKAMDWNNEGQADGLVPYGKIHQRIVSFLQRAQEEAQTLRSRSKSNAQKFDFREENY